MGSRALLFCVVGAVLIICCNAGSGSYSSSSSSSSSSSGNIHFGDPGQTYSGSFSSAGLGTRGGFDGPGLVVRQGVVEPGSGSKGVFTSSSSQVDSDGRIHYKVQSGRF